jgi:hypothetical protein
MADDEKDGPEPKVGYSRPPARTRFKAGQSGNPKGRPKGAKNFQTVIAAELNGAVQVTENGKRKTITKRQVIGKQLVNGAAAGDPKAIALLLNATRVYEAEVAAQPAEATFIRPEDRAVQAGILERLRAADEARRASEGPPPAFQASPEADTAARPIQDTPENQKEGPDAAE